MRRLGELRRGDSGIVLRVSGPNDLVERLLEMGFLEGSRVELAHESPWGRDPIAVKVRGSLIAIRRHDANVIEVSND